MPEPGPLVIIGGHEDREGDRTILREVAAALGGRPLLLSAAASKVPDEYVDTYRAAFGPLGVEVTPVTAQTPGLDTAFDNAGGLFISGGNQNRFMDDVGSTDLAGHIRSLRSRGGVIAGTSAGASVIASTMIARGPAEEAAESADIRLAHGLGLLEGAVVDQHFSERGRFGRLLAAIDERPDLIGIGVDENTALVVQGAESRVVGAGAVHLVVAAPVARSQYTLVVLRPGDSFDLAAWMPEPPER